ncbi:MAG: signal transduction histidine kinase/DNA-binding response OmpR family regulator [Rhodothermales bacterium]|jgi:signal transduction histidine kinase/DNA-binding response OmpR family regulator
MLELVRTLLINPVHKSRLSDLEVGPELDLTYTWSIEEAAARLGEQAFDVVVLDLSATGEDAWQYMANLLAVATAPVVLMALPEQAELACWCIEQGADDWLTKMSSPEILRAANRALARRQRAELQAPHLSAGTPTELAEEAWLKTGATRLHSVIRGEHEVDELCNNTLAFLCDYTEVEGGRLYLSDGQDTLRLIAGINTDVTAESADPIPLGASRMGNAARSAHSMIFREPHPDVVLLTRNFLVVPCIYDNGTLIGVIDLESGDTIREQDRRFLEEVAVAIAVSLRAALQRVEMGEVLRASQELVEELESQQVELRLANDDLEEQAKRLGNSEECLQDLNHELANKNRAIEQARLSLERKVGQLETANRYKSEFLANVSHELRTPLNSILILSKLLADNEHGHLDKEELKSAEVIRSSGSDLLGLIDETLDLSRIEAGSTELLLEDVRIADVMNDLKAMFAPVADTRQLGFTPQIRDETPECIHTDGQKLRQILRSLLASAFKVTESGGVRISIGPAGEGGLRVDVSDSGIPADQHAAIFDPFGQTDGSATRRLSGTGLGLAISQGLATLLGGSIELQSAGGEGSTFSLILPRQPRLLGDVEPEGGLVLVDVGELDVLSDDHAQVLATDRLAVIISSDAEFAVRLRDMANHHAFKAVLCTDLEDGIEQVCAHQQVDLVLVDEVLDDGVPGSAIDAFRVHAGTCTVPVVGVGAEDVQLDARRAGAIGYFADTADSDSLEIAFGGVAQLCSIVTRRVLVLEKGRFVRNNIAQYIGKQGIELEAVNRTDVAEAYLAAEFFHCMIMHVDLGRGDWLHVRRAVARHSPLLPVVVYTGRQLTDVEERRLEAFSAGAVVTCARTPSQLLSELMRFVHYRAPHLLSSTEPENVFLGKKILVVDDDMRNTFALARILQDQGVKVIMAENGLKAIEQLESQPDTDLVLMDVMMPVMDGYEAMQRIRGRAEFADLPILAVTARAMPSDREKCINAGANDYLAKPLSVDKLLAMLERWLQAGY